MGERSLTMGSGERAAATVAEPVTTVGPFAPSVRGPRRRGTITWVALCCVAIFLVRPFGATPPTSGLDPSWMLAVNRADDLGLRFGSDVVFTYGPWGWLTAPVALDRSTVLLAGVFATFAVVTLWWSLATALGHQRRSLPAAVAATVVTPLVFALTGASWSLVLGLFTLVLTRLLRGAGRSDLLVVGVSAAAGLLVMVKFSEGVLATALAIGVVLAWFSWRSALLAGAGYAGSLVGLWWLSGGVLGDLGAWLGGSATVAAGYADAMYLGPVASSGVLLAACLVVACLWTVRSQSRGGWTGWCAVLLVLGLLVFALKQGFTREDRDHVAAFFTAVVVVAAQWTGVRRDRWLRVLVLATAGLAVLGTTMAATQRPVRAGWSETASWVLSGERLDAALSAARRDMREAYDVSDPLVERLRDRPVVVDPFETNAAWAYGLDVLPLPVPQAYSAYTAELDRRNTEALLAAPRVAVLREEATIDDRFQLWDTPAYNLALACHFREVDRDERWTLLLRVADRCGRPRTSAPVRVRAGTPVAVPRTSDRDVVTVRFEPDDRPAWQRVVSAAFKDPAPLRARLGAEAWRRVPRRLAGGPLIVRLPESVTWSATQPRAGTLTFTSAGTVHFSVIAVGEDRRAARS